MILHNIIYKLHVAIDILIIILVLSLIPFPNPNTSHVNSHILLFLFLSYYLVSIFIDCLQTDGFRVIVFLFKSHVAFFARIRCLSAVVGFVSLSVLLLIRFRLFLSRSFCNDLLLYAFGLSIFIRLRYRRSLFWWGCLIENFIGRVLQFYFRDLSFVFRYFCIR